MQILYTDKHHVKDFVKNIAGMGCNDMTQPEASNVTIIERIGNIAVIIVSGDITLHSGLNIQSQMNYGICDLDTLNSAITTIQQDDSINTVLFWFNTYGGGADGLYSTWKAIDELSQSKICVAACDSKMCSAGYLLASACPIIVSTADSTIGSIGSVICIENDDDTVIASGIYKAAGNGQVETKEQTDYLQNMVNQEAERFWNIANVKHTLNDELKKGGAYRFDDQLKYGLVELQVESLTDVIIQLLQ